MRVVIADDAALVRSGLATLLAEQDVEVVGEAADALSLLALVPQVRPDAAVVDIRMPPTHTTEGIAAAREIRARHPEVAVLVLSQYAESAYAADLIEEDPSLELVSIAFEDSGFRLKDALMEIALSEAFRLVARPEGAQ